MDTSPPTSPLQGGDSLIGSTDLKREVSLALFKIGAIASLYKAFC
jgi:hypothetical protein